MSICPKCHHDRTTRAHKESCGGGTVRAGAATQPASMMPGPSVLKLIKLAKAGITFEDLCNKLDCSPKQAHKLIALATERKAPLHIEHNMITVAPSPALEVVQDILIARAKGKRAIIGAISDTHLGSKYCLRGALREAIQWMYDQGARDIVHSGDVLEGCYKHARWELSHVGFDAQVRDAAKCFPQLKGLRYHFITGNHDFTFEDQIGMRCGIAIQDALRSLGRPDWTCYGDRNAYLRLGGAVVNLWHPGGGGAYARSYHLQKRIEGYAAIKPHVLLMGHYHQYGVVYERGVHGIGMPCFQGSGSNFAQSLKGSPAIGGLLLSWSMSETDRIHDFEIHPRFFFERDDIFNPRDDGIGQEVQAVGRDHRYRKGEKA